jgi:hypothetical protein
MRPAVTDEDKMLRQYEGPDALRKAEAFGTQHGCDIEARRALSELRDAPDVAAAARALAQMFGAVAELLSHASIDDPGGLPISPDSATEYKRLVGRARRAVLDEYNADKRARTYIENRIIRAAGHVVEGKLSIEGAAQRVVELTHDDAHTRHLVEKLVTREAELIACVKAAVARNAGHGKGGAGKFPPPGTRWGLKAIEAYDAEFDQLCVVLGVQTATPATRASELSRIRRKRASKP